MINKEQMDRERIEKINYIRETCIEVNPDIVKIQFGCRVDIPLIESESRIGKVNKGTVIDSFIEKDISWSKYNKTNDKISVYMDSGEFRPMIGIKKNKIKILGRPIRLADILLCINLSTYFDYSVSNVYTNEISLLKVWNLQDNTLEEQDDETIDFIYRLFNEIERDLNVKKKNQEIKNEE